MTLVRILVDGNGLLEQWPELAPGKPRRSESAREELIHTLTQYLDAEGVPVTVVLDAIDGGVTGPGPESTAEMEILFIRPGQPVRPCLVRLATKLETTGQVLIVTDQPAAENESTVISRTYSTCEDFRHCVRNALADLERKIEQLNFRENQQFSQHG